MVKIILNLLLSFLLGKLKPVLLKHIEMVEPSMMSGGDKFNSVVKSFKEDLVAAGKGWRNNLIELVVKSGVQLLREKGVLQ